eukprot:4102379-Pyramimonas_sp.AAC.1
MNNNAGGPRMRTPAASSLNATCPRSAAWNDPEHTSARTNAFAHNINKLSLDTGGLRTIACSHRSNRFVDARLDTCAAIADRARCARYLIVISTSISLDTGGLRTTACSHRSNRFVDDRLDT